MKHRSLLAGLSALAVTAGLTAGVAAPASALPDAPYEPDFAPAREGAAWLTGQLTDGLMVNPNFGGFTDYGLTVDTGLALADVGEPGTVDTISAALAPEVRSYYTYFVTAEKTHVSAGSLAKATAFVQDAGDDTSAYGGQDLVTQLEARVSTASGSAGRLGDVFFPEEQYEADYANTIGQAFAAKALDVEGSTRAASVTDYLLAQQCSDGFFRLALGATAADTCDTATPAATPSTDVTALAIINLQSQLDDPVVAAAVTDALTWLKGTQNPDGSFGSDAMITTANANSTGLAGWALGDAESSSTASYTDAARSAAVWLRTRQVANTASCRPYAGADEGAVAYDDAALESVTGTPITQEAQDQFRRATAQALPALTSAPDGVVPTPYVSDYVRARSVQRVDVAASPGDVVCLVGNGTTRLRRVPTTGTLSFSFTLPSGTGNRAYAVQDGDEVVYSRTYRALGSKTLKVRALASVRRGAQQRVVLTGLAAGEQVKVSFGGKVVARGKAGSKGRFQRAFTVPVKAGLGQRKLRVVGEFSTRVGTTTFKVTRAK
ncbi:prenyltransferase/squalene oxidase repeat-containing protein [Nocardioides sp.]|uniref:prenyltransferase/squalene oxidase repeat-containing protein n=1 Tax=Nocardioides sp. TaxID=35761 RepID=UPI0027271C8C|nr:prenyltransferase/squalene oxidase repeat-containing protein [Nocardioides sp.]MDO9458387.1 terpene cyclase/mutase family protein [Nocardioides sp.]